MELDRDKNQLPLERALGLQWCRGISSVVSSLYDPLGFVAPFTVPGKLVLQELCKLSHLQCAKTIIQWTQSGLMRADVQSDGL